MARPQQQMQQQTKTIRLPVVGLAQNRQISPDKDQRFVNYFPESLKTPINSANKLYLVKRSGLTLRNTIVPGGAVGRGCYYYAGHLYSIFGNTLYKDTTSITTLSTTTGTVGWAEATGSTKYLFLCDGIDGYTIDTSGNVTKVIPPTFQVSTSYSVGDRVKPTTDNGFWYRCTTAGTSGSPEPTWPTIIGSTVTTGSAKFTTVNGGFPTPHVPQPAFIDGYIFLIKSGTADIYNSNLELPLDWPTSDFITAEMYPDDLLGLARQNNQVVAMGHTSTEFFYDAANSSGSPLGRTDAAVLQFGTCAPFATFQNERFCIIVAQSASGGRAIWEIDGFTPKKISTEYVEKILDAEGETIFTATGIGVRTQGHLFYILNLTTQNRTFVYDLEERMWHEWSTNDGSGNHTMFKGLYATDDETGKAILQHATNGNIYYLDPFAYKDETLDIICDAVTSKADFDTMNRKFVSLVTIVGDINPSSSPITIRWTDDDYQTWSNWKTLNLNTPRPYFARLGHFRRRAMQVRFVDNNPCRLEALEFEVSLGVS